MAVVSSNISVHSNYAPIIVHFLPSEDSSDPEDRCEIDSRKPQKLGGIMGAAYVISAQLNNYEQALVFYEEVSGSIAWNGVQATFTIPITKLEDPTFHNTVYDMRPCLEISFTVRRGQALTCRHFSWNTLGTWHDETASKLQMWDCDYWASETRTIKIILPAPHNIHKIKTDIQRALNLPMSQAQPTRLPMPTASPASLNSLFDTNRQVPGAGVAKTPTPAPPAAPPARVFNFPMFEGDAEARRRNDAEALVLNLANTTVPPSRGTSTTPFISVIEKDRLNSCTGCAYQSITRMRSYQQYSFEELRMVDYEAGHRMGDPRLVYHIQSIRAEKLQWREMAATSDQEASYLRAKLANYKASRLMQQAQLTDSRRKAKDWEIKAEAIQAKYQASLEQVAGLQNQVKHLKEGGKLHEDIQHLRKQLEAANAKSQAANNSISTDLLCLDFDEDTAADSTLVSNGAFLLQEFSTTIDIPGEAGSPIEESVVPSHHLLQTEAATTTSSTKRQTGANSSPTSTKLPSTGGSPPITVIAPTSPISVDMILHIDDAVDAVSARAREALRAGKGVTVQITEPEPVGSWLQMVHEKVSADEMGRVKSSDVRFGSIE